MSGVDSFDLDIAVVGLAGRFPGAPDVPTFWRNLQGGVESIRDLSEEELRAAGADDALLSDPQLVRRAADLTGVDLFDAGLFGFTPREAELADPQLRAFLEDAWTALEDAGHLSDAAALRVGVFAGGSASTYFESFVRRNPRAAEAVGAFQTSLGNDRDYLATQVSYRLDLRGPSVVVQTACSTSLVAVHLAVQSLLNRECDVALAGGVSITVPQTAGYMHSEGDITSPDGRCRAFDAAAAGVVKGNGSGVVVLRRLADALADGDAVRAVIKGSAVNNDGSVKVGFTAPSVEGQAGVISEALAAAGVDPATIDYVEAHGTGTPLGDPVEVAALARALGPRDDAHGRRALGSVKTNVGHLDAAAGVTGLIKVILSLQHGEIPASLHFERPNPRLELDRAGLFVNAALRPWTANGGPRRAGVSSFGIGGTNAHVVVEEAPAAAETTAGGDDRPQALVLSAATETALAAASEAIARTLESRPDLRLADAAYTLQVGRKRLPWRRSVVAGDRAEAVAALRGAGRPDPPVHDERRGADVVFLFPGQGAQRAGMARGLHRGEKAFRDELDRCAEILRPALGLDLREPLLAGFDDAAAAELLRRTEITQPALFAVELALAELWRSWGIRPAAMAGHSIGEYTAACLAGVMPAEDALALVAERGRLMGSGPPGAMLAVHLPEAELAARLAAHPDLSLAVVNGPSACVASGPEEAIVRLEEDLAPAGVGCRRLRTSHAFHSAMMDPVLPAFEARVARVALRAPTVPFLSNVSGTWITDAEATDPAYWARHLRRTVRWADNARVLAEDPSRILLETGPGNVLTQLVRSAGATAVASLPAPGSGEDDRRSVIRALGRVWSAGADVDWAAHHGAPRRRRPLPTYPFERKRHWIDVDPAALRVAPSATAPAKNPDVAAWFWIPGWRRARATAAAPVDAEPAWLLLDDGSALARELAGLAEVRGARVITARAGRGDLTRDGDSFVLDPARTGHFEELFARLREDGQLPRRIVHLWCAAGAAPRAALDLGFHALIHLLRAAGQHGGTDDLRLVAVTRGLFDVAGDPTRDPERATLIGPCRVAPQEVAGLSCRLVDLADGDDAAGARRIGRELDLTDREPVAAWRGGHRWVPSAEPARLDAPRRPPAPVREDGAYLLTGGAGPLEIAVARRLAAEGARAVGFLGAGPAAAGALDALRAAGLEVVTWEAGVPDGAAAAVGELRRRFGRVDAVFHTAGEIGGGMIQLKERDAAERILAPRLAARGLADLLHDGEELVLFSSGISRTGVFGQVDYCGACAFLDAFAASRRGAPGPRVRAVDWGMAHWDRWQDAAGPAADALLAQLRAILEEVGITVEEGVDALWRALSEDAPEIVVSTQDLDEMIAQARNASVSDVLEGVAGGETGGRTGEGGALESETEARIAAVWTELLGIGGIGRGDSFFDLGGNSLLAIQLASRLRKSFDIELPIATLFESADLAALAASVDAALEGRRAEEEIARLLDEIEALPEDEVRAQLERDADAGGDA